MTTTSHTGPADRGFDMTDQQRFAALSGDYNPMHLDPVVARRTMAGEPVVHGMHILLWSLDVVADRASPPPTSIRADFTAFLPLGRPISLDVTMVGGKRRIVARSGDRAVMMAELRHDAEPGHEPTMPSHRPSDAPREANVVTLGDVEGLAGALVCPTGADAAAAFPNAAAWLGPERVAALLACTCLVGMICPGLHSIFNRIDVRLDGGDCRAPLDYSVSTADQRFRRVLLSVASSGFHGTLYTSVRPAPVEQPTMAALMTAVESDAFAHVRALVVGGSRGLGEVAAKLLAAGGADVLLTYAVGRDEAEAVCRDIVARGGSARTVQLDVLGDIDTRLGEHAAGSNACFYFATPKIFSTEGTRYREQVFKTFSDVYVNAFARLCDYLAGLPAPLVSVYYPSSIAIDERPPGLVEYAMAKAAGEILCDEYDRDKTNLKITRSRLPRLQTDQTSTIVEVAAASTVDIMLPILSRTANSIKQ